MVTEAEIRDRENKTKLLTVEELAVVLNVPKSWIYQRTRLGKRSIPHIKFGKYVRFNSSEVIRFFNEEKADVCRQ